MSLSTLSMVLAPSGAGRAPLRPGRRGGGSRGLPLAAAVLAASTIPSAAARADDRELCGRPGLDLACLTVGPGFNVVPQEPASLRTYYVTMAPLPTGGPARPGKGASPNIVYGGSGYTSAWGADAPARRADGSVVF